MANFLSNHSLTEKAMSDFNKEAKIILSDINKVGINDQSAKA